MKVLAIAHGLWRGGGQEATLGILKMLKRRGIDIKVLTCTGANKTFLSDIEELGIPTFAASSQTVANYPDISVREHAELVKSSDVVWITDVEYLAAPKIKRISDIPIIAHLHCYALACPIWTAFYGMRETCTENCSHSLRRFAQCKQLAKQYLAHWHQRSGRMKMYQLLNYPKSLVDFVSWPMNQAIVESIDGLVTVSDFTRDLMRIHLPHLNDIHVEVIPNPVMIPEPRIIPESHEDSSGRTILYASGPGIIKGPHIALYAIRKLLDEGCNEFTMTMLGVKGNAWIKDLVRRLRIEKHVRLLGRLPTRAHVAALMESSACVLLPSIYPEPLPTVPIEANLLGTPSIVSNMGGLPSTIVDKVTGLVTEPSVEAVAKSVDEALRTDWNRELIARTAKERFDPERSVNHLVHFMETFI